MATEMSNVRGLSCRDSRPCFARTKSIFSGKSEVCVLLSSVYPDGKCPFCKPDREITKGIYYPYNEGMLNRLPRKEAVGNVEN